MVQYIRKVERGMIVTYTGPMHSGKSEKLMDCYDKIYNKKNILVFKPSIDVRDYGVIKCKGRRKKVKAILIDRFEEILDYVTDEITNIFIDEVQFMQGNIKTLLKLSIIDDIDIYCAGLNMTGEQEPFGLLPDVMAISDKVINVYSSCSKCGRKATYTYYDGVKGEILVGDEGYLSLCRKCLKMVLINKGDNRLEIRK